MIVSSLNTLSAVYHLRKLFKSMLQAVDNCRNTFIRNDKQIMTLFCFIVKKCVLLRNGSHFESGSHFEFSRVS